MNQENEKNLNETTIEIEDLEVEEREVVGGESDAELGAGSRTLRPGGTTMCGW